MAAAEPTITFLRLPRQITDDVTRASARHGGLVSSLAAIVLFSFIVAAFSLTAANMLRFVGIVLGLFFVLVTVKHKLVPAPEALLYAAWVIWSSVSYFGSEHTDPFMQGYRVVLQMTVLLFGVSTITRYLARPAVPLAAILIGAVVSAGYALLAGEFYSPVGLGDERVSGLLGNANGFGYQMLLSLMAAAMLWGIVRTRRSRYLLMMVCPLLVAALISSGSRKNFLGFMLFLLLWTILALRQRYRLRLRFFFISGIVLAGAIFLYDFVMEQTIIGRRFHSEFNELSAQEMRGVDRFEYYMIGLEIITKNPIIGIGFGNFKIDNPYNQDSHSDYIEVAVSTGILGAVIYFAIYVVLWRRLKRIKKISPAYGYLSGCSEASVLTVLFVSLGMLQFSAPIHWCFVGILSGLDGRRLPPEHSDFRMKAGRRPEIAP